MMNGLDLFSGIGGISIALSPWVRPIAYCESDRHAQAVLLSRMHDGSIPQAPIWDDVRTLRGDQLPKVDIIYGGFPCQDISSAGRGAGMAGERSGLVSEIFRLTKELRPTLIFLENVPAIRTRGLGRVVSTLAGIGYDCRWTIVSAAEIGAPHIRKRWFMLAHSRREFVRIESGRGSGTDRQGSTVVGNDGAQPNVANATGGGHSRRGPAMCGESQSNIGRRGEVMADTMRVGLERTVEKSTGPDGRAQPNDDRWWQSEPNVGRVADGVPNRVDRLRGLGNSVVPAQAREAFQRLLGR